MFQPLNLMFAIIVVKIIMPYTNVSRDVYRNDT